MTKAIVLAAVLAGGCVTAPVESAEQVPAAETATGHCDASKVSAMVGKPHTPALAEEARKLSGAKTVRSIRPGDVVTMDYREDRLNLRIDGQGRVEGASCG